MNSHCTVKALTVDLSGLHIHLDYDGVDYLSDMNAAAPPGNRDSLLWSKCV